MSVAYAITDEDVDVPETYRQAEDTQITQGFPAARSESDPRRGHWFEDAAQQLRAVETLGTDWDTNGAAATHAETLKSGDLLLRCLGRVPSVPKPHINPTREGGVQFEWESESRYFEIEVVARGSARYFYQDEEAGVEEEGEVFEGERLDVIVQHILQVASAM